MSDVDDLAKRLAEKAVAHIAPAYEAKLAACERQVNELAEINKELLEALELILPMARGYSIEHPFGSNKKYISIVEKLIAIAKAEK